MQENLQKRVVFLVRLGVAEIKNEGKALKIVSKDSSPVSSRLWVMLRVKNISSGKSVREIICLRTSWQSTKKVCNFEGVDI